jgi:hypothetical protein
MCLVDGNLSCFLLSMIHIKVRSVCCLNNLIGRTFNPAYLIIKENWLYGLVEHGSRDECERILAFQLGFYGCNKQFW